MYVEDMGVTYYFSSEIDVLEDNDGMQEQRIIIKVRGYTVFDEVLTCDVHDDTRITGVAQMIEPYLTEGWNTLEIDWGGRYRYTKKVMLSRCEIRGECADNFRRPYSLMRGVRRIPEGCSVRVYLPYIPVTRKIYFREGTTIEEGPVFTSAGNYWYINVDCAALEAENQKKIAMIQIKGESTEFWTLQYIPYSRISEGGAIMFANNFGFLEDFFFARIDKKAITKSQEVVIAGARKRIAIEESNEYEGVTFPMTEKELQIFEDLLRSPKGRDADGNAIVFLDGDFDHDDSRVDLFVGKVKFRYEKGDKYK